MQKKLLICMLVATGITGKLFSQIVSFPLPGQTKAGLLFEVANPSWLRNTFVIDLPKGNKIKIEVADKQGLEYVMNIDSLVKQCYDRVLLLPDSFRNETSSRRVDYYINRKGNDNIRLQEFPSSGKTYTYKDKEMYALKIEQDTINMIGLYQSAKPVRWSKKPLYLGMPYRVTILLNNISDLKDCLQYQLNTYTQKIKTDWIAYNQSGNEDSWSKRLRATYNTVDETRSMKFGNNRTMDKKDFLAPYIGFGVQNMHNLFAPSIAGGIDIYSTNNNKPDDRFNDITERHFSLYADNYFFFDNSPNAARKILVNKFLTFQYKEVSLMKLEGQKQSFQYYQQWSLGYLIDRKGDYFEKNSFRLGLPGFQYRNIVLTPGLFFNNLFQQTSPTLQLTLFLE